MPNCIWCGHKRVVIGLFPTHDSDECLLGNRSTVFSKKKKKEKGRWIAWRNEKKRNGSGLGYLSTASLLIYNNTKHKHKQAIRSLLSLFYSCPFVWLALLRFYAIISSQSNFRDIVKYKISLFIYYLPPINQPFANWTNCRS